MKASGRPAKVAKAKPARRTKAALKRLVAAGPAQRQRRAAKGGLLRHIAALAKRKQHGLVTAPWRCGPTSVDEAFMWPAFATTMMKERHLASSGLDLFQSMVDKLKGGIDFSTDYSGIGQAEAVVEQLRVQVKLLGVDLGGDIKMVRAGDINPICREVLRAHGAGCIHGDIVARMPAHLHARVSKLADKAREVLMQSDMSTAKLARRSHEQANAIVVEGLGNIFNDTHSDSVITGLCYKHMSSNCIAAKREERGARGRLQIHVAGVSCLDWSSRGKRQGLLGATFAAFAQWLHERVVCQEDCIIVECTRHFDPAVLVRVLHNYDVQKAVFSPLQMGFGVNRHRCYVLCLRLDRLRWDMPGDLRATLQDVLFRSSVLHGSAYFRAPSELVQAMVDKKADKRGMPQQQPNGKPWQFKHVCARGMSCRIQRYKELAVALPGRLHDEDEDYICDLHQFEVAGMVTRHIPALTRTSEVYSFAMRRTMLGIEKLEVQGFLVFTPPGFPFDVPFRSMIDTASGKAKLADARLHALAGNSMHAAAIGGVLLLALGGSIVVDPASASSETS